MEEADREFMHVYFPLEGKKSQLRAGTLFSRRSALNAAATAGSLAGL